MTYQSDNQAKANFDDVYTAPTPHRYLAKMAATGYQIGERARPFCQAAAEWLTARNGSVWPTQMLDVGCSYGIGSAFVKYGCTFDEIVSFFASRAPDAPDLCAEATRQWLNVTPPKCDVRVVGLDSSGPAIEFAVSAGLLDGGLTHDFETADDPATDEELAWFRGCNLLISTGAIGYVTARTLRPILANLGADHPTDAGPVAVVTILRMFDPEPIAECFADAGFEFGPLRGTHLIQRRFADTDERDGVMRVLARRGMRTAGLEDTGFLYADLFVAARPSQFADFRDHLVGVHESSRHARPLVLPSQHVPGNGRH